jgi:transposase
MLVTMTDKDIYRLGIIQRVHDHTLLQREAARLLELAVRQVQRVLRRYREHGAASLFLPAAVVPAITAFPKIYAALLCN